MHAIHSFKHAYGVLLHKMRNKPPSSLSFLAEDDDDDACLPPQASLSELSAINHAAASAAADAARDAARERVSQAEAGTEAAARELAGAESGDGRDESNRSLPERLADAKNAQTAADAEAKQVRVLLAYLYAYRNAYVLHMLVSICVRTLASAPGTSRQCDWCMTACMQLDHASPGQEWGQAPSCMPAHMHTTHSLLYCYHQLSRVVWHRRVTYVGIARMQADIAHKHLTKCLVDARKASASAAREDGGLAAEVAKQQAAVEGCTQALQVSGDVETAHFL